MLAILFKYKEQFEIVPQKYAVILQCPFSLSKQIKSIIPLMAFIIVWNTFQCSVSPVFFFTVDD